MLIDDINILWDTIIEELAGTPSNAAVATAPYIATASNIATVSNLLSRSEEYEEAAMKLIILLTDGEGTYSNTHSQTAIERGIKIYTIGLGSSYDEKLLKKIASDTGANYYHADSAEDLIEEFKALTTDTVDIITDSDGDGLSNYHEERIRLFNGTTIRLDKNKADTDGDGLLDGDEIVQTTDWYGRVFFKMYSHPNKADSDGDGITDGTDLRRLIYDIVPVYVTDESIVFNTGKHWKRLPVGVTAFEYLRDISSEMWDIYDDLWNNNVDNTQYIESQIEELKKIAKEANKNGDTEYVFEELRKSLFESLVERKSKTYQYHGRFANPMFVEVEEGTEGGFWSGKVISEYDLNLSMRFYHTEPDANDLVDTIITGIVYFTAVLTVNVTTIVAANIQAIHYYCQIYGIKDGLHVYRMLGTQYVPNGIFRRYRLVEARGT